VKPGADAQSVGRVGRDSVATPDGVRRRRHQAESTRSDTAADPAAAAGGRIEGDGITMNQIMQLAWDITTDELVANTPKWWNETKYSIIAQTSDGGERCRSRLPTSTSTTSRRCCDSS
jgi:uncharacterized protein (TIGR03435 family)